MSIAELVGKFSTLEVSDVNPVATDISAKVASDGVPSLEKNSLMEELKVRASRSFPRGCLQSARAASSPCCAFYMSALSLCMLRSCLQHRLVRHGIGVAKAACCTSRQRAMRLGARSTAG